jgi:isopentenyldiphosphate isomerase
VDTEAWIPIVDEQDEVVGTALRSEMRAKNLLHRCTAVIVLSTDEDRLLVHQRSATKSFWPLWWDIAAGGVVEVDENLDDAAERELAEELGVDIIDRGALSKLGSGRSSDHELDVFMHVWLTHHDGPFSCPDGEVDHVEWVTPEELYTRIRTDLFVRDTVSVGLPLLQQHSKLWQPSGHD